ncbi:MAG: histidine phosphatase family protein [Clostridia bacterium]|nr:histidine phosphatase family protein [Clostridia bacterium]
MKKVYFIRHGESQWNVEDKICGRTDSPLTERGRMQALETGRMLLESGICADAILYSPLSRAKDTALAIAAVTGLPATEEPLLMEQAFGRWEGTSPRNSAAFREAKKGFATNFGDGESMLRLGQRIYNLLDRLAEDDRTYVLVAHNGIARVVKSYFSDMTNEEFADYGVKNCSVTEFVFPERAE